MTLGTGQVLQNRYRIVALLGQGGMGAVYRAWDMRLGVAVALKEMTPEPGLDTGKLQARREQFHQEASVLSRLNHPHLVRVSDFFDEGGSTYLVMAFVEGESLAAYIDRVGARPEAEVLGWADQLLDALAYCHREGVLHRDIKPQNVILQPDGNIILVDFGLVKLWDPADPRTRTVIRSVGTPEYAPPEQYDFSMGHTDPRSDLYSLGATLYHALTGQVPPTATVRIVNPGALVPARQYNTGASTRVERALERAMALQPDPRFQSAADMRLALATQAAPRPQAQGHTQRMPGVPSAPGRRISPKVAGLIIAGLVLCAIGVGIGLGAVYWFVNRGGAASETGVVQQTPATATAQAGAPGAMDTPVLVEVIAPTPEPSPTPTLAPSPTLRPSSTPIPIPSSTPVPSDTPVPACPDVTGPFAAVWQGHRDELGCAQRAAYEASAAQEHFERGMMTWRSDNDRIYAHYTNGAWGSYADIWVEGDPTYSCGTQQTPPTPVRGFGKIWCTYDAVRSGLGNATGQEVGQTVLIQPFEGGFILRSQPGDVYVFLNSGRWWVQ